MSVHAFSDEQVHKARHALGLSRQKVAYRNFYSSYDADRDWEDLVARGFAIKRKSPVSPDFLYHVSAAAKFFFLDPGETIGEDVRFPSSPTP